MNVGEFEITVDEKEQDWETVKYYVLDVNGEVNSTVETTI